MITIVVGAQYGGEGKGKVCSYLGSVRRYKLVCRTGGVNSSHSVHFSGQIHRLRMMPASAVVQRSCYVFGAGTLLDLDILFSEAERLGVSDEQILIDPRAGIITADIVAEQRTDSRYELIGSTLTGTGYGSARRCRRELLLACDVPRLKPFLTDVVSLLFDAALASDDILVEGHQGAGLSNYHGDYPFASSRDCIAAALMSELGLGTRWRPEVVLAVKVFPTRNHAGRLPGELSPEEAVDIGVVERGGGSPGIPDRRRRVGAFDIEDVRRAIMLNTPDYIALTGLDYLFPEIRNASRVDELPLHVRRYLNDLEEQMQVPIGFVSTGPEVNSTVDFLGEKAELGRRFG